MFSKNFATVLVVLVVPSHSEHWFIGRLHTKILNIHMSPCTGKSSEKGKTIVWNLSAPPYYKTLPSYDFLTSEEIMR